MESSILKKAGKSLSEQKKRRHWKGIVAVLAVVVMLGTALALSFPALTLEKEVYCGLEEHKHVPECYEQVLICGIEEGAAKVAETSAESVPDEAPAGEAEPEVLGHQHADACYTETKTLSCTQEENGGHQHGDGCYTITEKKELSCGQEESEEHTHTEECYTITEEKTLACGTEEGAGAHIHEDGCYTVTKELSCGQEESAAKPEAPKAPEQAAGAAPEGAAEGETHVHTQACYEQKLICGKEEHGHVEKCYEIITCGQEEHAHIQECHDAEGNVVCGKGEHIHIQKCHMQVFCGLENHLHTDACKDETGNIACGKEEHVHEYGCYTGPEVSIEDRERIIKVDTMIDALPGYPEIEEKLNSFPDEDVEGYEAYYNEILFQVSLAYAYFEDLNAQGDLQKYVVNSENLTALSVFWETALTSDPEAKTVRVHSINTMGPANTVALVYAEGGTAADVIQDGLFAEWTAWIVEQNEEGQAVIADMIPAGNDTWSQKMEIGLSPERFILFSHGTATASDMANVVVGNSVQLDFEYTALPNEARAVAYGTAVFGENGVAAQQVGNISTIQAASTKDFLEIKLFDYGPDINEPFDSDSMKYPGFQQDFGVADGTALSGTWASGYGFGNNITTDYDAGGNSIVKRVDGTNNPEWKGNINSQRGAHANTDKPDGTGLSNTALYAEYSPMSKRLGADGYPLLSNGTSLGYLFDNTVTLDVGHGKKAYAQLKGSGLDGLFTKDEETGAYNFDSRVCHAQFNGKDGFTLYNSLLTPNFVQYPFGNFMPFNTITESVEETGAIGRGYYERMQQNAQEKADSCPEGSLKEQYTKLAKTLGQFIETMDGKHGSQAWNSRDLQGYYFDAVKKGTAGANKDDKWLDKVTGANNAEAIQGDPNKKLYNIDFDEPKNFFFGMTMEMNYVQPKDGKTGTGNKYDTVFEFAGDDDVWVYVDGTLLLDLSGIHRHVAGRIDFTKGEVVYYGYHSYAAGDRGAITGRTSNEPEETYTFERIIRETYGAQGDEKVKELLKFDTAQNKYTTFKDYTTHNFKFYYMERGAGSSVCRINFNFPVIPKNSIAISKDITTDGNQAVLGNPDFEFQVLNADAYDKTTIDIPGDLYVKPGTKYNIYDLNGVDTNRDGRVDQNGLIKLKAGEMAVIEGIKADQGEYFVRELLDPSVFEQFGAHITTGGTTETKVNWEDISIGGATFKGAKSPIKNIDDGEVTTFGFINKVDFDKTGSLEITKNVTGGKDEVKKEFDFEVTLDEKKIPTGTPYKVDGQPAIVKKEGIITLKAGQTALIENILAGSNYTVQETADSEEGFSVSYTIEEYDTASGSVSNGNSQVTQEGGRQIVKGMIAHHTKVCVQIVNTGGQYGNLVIKKVIADGKGAYVENDVFYFQVYMEDLETQQLVPYTGEYYLKDADGFYYKKNEAGKPEKTQATTADSAMIYDNAQEGVIALPSHLYQIELFRKPAGMAFYVAELTDEGHLDPNKYVIDGSMPLKELTQGTYQPDTSVTSQDGTVSDGQIKDGQTAEVIVTNKLRNWQMYKRSKSSETKFLEGAEFRLVSEGDITVSYTGISDANGLVKWTDNISESGTVSEIDTCQIKAGTYILTEIKSPLGYLLSTEQWKFTFSSDGAVPTVTAVLADGATTEVVPAEIEADGNKTMAFYFEDEAVYVLPSAGGEGIYWYSIGGTLLMLAATLILYKKRYKGVLIKK